MAIVKTDSDNYSSIANAIRYKNGTTNKYKPAEMEIGRASCRERV